ncbi:SDR family oxidoreductase [Catenuloplanes japonicus]|uniref:SDR family oxidoreductase n=1 Tax=Catenuloplanes japonicus TaxID=33876 RepID=UPI00052745CF|nr:SDR family oxidoreductase [Catenuloplanes japonicus]
MASVAFITGGAQGIGLGIARAFGKRGVRLVLADIDEAALARAAAELSGVTEVRTVRLDVRDRAGFAEAADRAEEALGPVDLLVNNAGIVPVSAAADLSYEKWDLALGINLTGVVNGIQTFLPRMIARDRGGYVVNTASGNGLIANANPLYVTAKFAVVGLSESLRPALERHGIGVSVLCPGPVDTGIVGNTQATDPSVALHGELRAGVEAFLRGGVSIDEVGEMVVAGVEARSMWIHTGNEIRPHLERRAAELLASVPS